MSYMGYYVITRIPPGSNWVANRTMDFTEYDFMYYLQTDAFRASTAAGWGYKIFFYEEALKKFLFKKRDLEI